MPRGTKVPGLERGGGGGRKGVVFWPGKYFSTTPGTLQEKREKDEKRGKTGATVLRAIVLGLRKKFRKNVTF
jgi:hypothetical protein